MRAKRSWVGKQLPMQPFVEWLCARKVELALPVQERRYLDRDESLSRLSKATGIDPSTLIKWMRYESSKGQPKNLITPEKISEVLAKDGTSTLEALYPAAEVIHLTSSQTPRLARAA